VPQVRVPVGKRSAHAFLDSVSFPPDLIFCLSLFVLTAAARRFREREPVVVIINTLALSEVCWRVIPLATPHVLRHCAKCAETRPFASSDKFRLNAQQRKIDVWLIYKCLVCESTWNCTIVSRRTAKEIGAALYLRFQQNDKELAWTCAFDVSLLSRAGVQINEAVAVQVERFVVNHSESSQREQKIRLELAYPGVIRLDRLLAEQLHVSRSCLQRWFDHGSLLIWPEENNALRKSARNGQIIYLRQEV
jgi:hypothetical protein